MNDEPRDPATLINLHKLKVRAEFIGDFEDVKKISDMLKKMGGNNYVAAG